MRAKLFSLRMRFALFVALLQAFLPVMSYASMAARQSLTQEVCSADGSKRSLVLVDGKLMPAPESGGRDHGDHCSLCASSHGALPGGAFSSPPVDAPAAHLITVGASHFQPRALGLSPPPRGPPSAL